MAQRRTEPHRLNQTRTTRSEAESDAGRHSLTTGREWLVGYRPRLRSFHAYSTNAVERAPFGEPVHLVSVWRNGERYRGSFPWPFGKDMRRTAPSRDRPRTKRGSASRRDPAHRKIGSRIRSEGDTLVVKEVLSDSWIVGRNPRGNYVVANRNPYTKRWDSLEWFATMAPASAALHRRARGAL